MRSEEEIRERLKRLEEDLRDLEWEKKMVEEMGDITIGYTLQIEDIKTEIKVLKWVLGEDEEKEVGGG